MSLDRAPTAVRRSRLRDPLVLGLGAAVVALAVAAAALARRGGKDGEDPFPVRTVITLDANGPIGSGVLSPDGHSVVYSGMAQSGNGRAYYIRRLDQLTAREIPGTERSFRAPAFSPDGKWMAFIQDRRSLVKVPLDGGAPVTLAAVPDYGGLAWSRNGQIVLGAGVDEGLQGLYRVSDAGGSIAPLTHIDTSCKELSHQQPRVLADGKTVLFTIWFGSDDRAEIGVTSLDDGKVVPLGILGVAPIGVIDGRLLYVGANGRVMAVPFDVQTRRVSGTPTLVQDDVGFRGGGGSDHDEVSMTDDGGLVYLRGNENRRLLWVDRNGKSTPVVEMAREYTHIRLSPNGRRAAVTIATGAKRDIWTIDLAAGTLTPFTTTGTARNPMWSSDGQRILYASTQSGRAGFWWQPADGSGPPQLAVVPRRNPWFADLSPDGRNVVFNGISDVNFDLESVSLDSTHRARALSASPTAIEVYGRFSPDGRWVAYTSDESGRAEVYVRPFAEGDGRVQISVNGGRRPIWDHDGKQLYYWEGSRLVSASLTFGPMPVVVSRTSLFAGRFEDDFDVAKDGRFIMIQSETSGTGLVVIPNWRTELRRLTAGR